MIVVSACLLGHSCRYDGGSNPVEAVIDLARNEDVVAVCPEVLGGLPTPRVPSERMREKVVTAEGGDVTEAFRTGALAAFEICKAHGCTEAILKARSPSCGCGHIYDGSFSGRLVRGNGVFAEMLLAEGIPVRTEENL